MAAFLDDDFLLRTDAARQLYHGRAASLPIYDYHCHLPPQQIAVNYQFRDLYDLWLAGDHYKWRAMRTAGVAERFCTGDATPYEKFLAYARTVPQTLRNPLYHWTHLELRRTFGIDELLDESTARSIWDRANEQLPHLTTHQLLTKYRVAVVCTTDDPADPLDHHVAIRKAGTLRTRVYPTFRPDKALTVDQPATFNAWVDKLAGTSGVDCGSFAGFLDAIKGRHDAFHAFGGRLSDHGLNHCDADDCTEAQARQAFDDARAGRAASPAEAARYRSFMMVYFGQLDAERGWTKQLHLGAQRNNSGRALGTLGPDTGFDSMGDWSQAAALGRYLDRLDRDGRLPKTILYNVNPTDNYMLATMAGNFQDGSVPGKIQFGSGWWFLDQKQGIEMQVDALSSVGLLSRFVGMLTDSRSFLSYPRHEYFRRVVCNMIGQDIADGEIPDDPRLVGDMVADICYHNAHRYFGLDVPAASAF